MRNLSILVACGAFVVLGACAPAQLLPTSELRARASAVRCEMPQAGHVTYTGDSAALDDCLEQLGISEVAKLRLNSRGGSAMPTLELAQRLVGKIDLVVVDGVCASSCANYLLAIADRLVVEPGSLILLHGAIDVETVSEYLDKNQGELRRQAPQMSEEETMRALERVLANTREDARYQGEFASARLACRDWLDPDLHFRPGDVPEGLEYLVATKAMTIRCFKRTRVERFWEPSKEDQERLAAEGIVVARR